MSDQIEIQTESREFSGTADSRRLRHAGKIPAVLYGAGKDNEHFIINHDEMLHNLEKEGFTATILAVKTNKGVQQAILRDVQMHPYKPLVMHVDFLRIKASEAMTIKVPVHLVGEDKAPGTNAEGGILSQSINDIDITCLPKDLPEYLEVDISELGMNESLHLTDIILPEGVQINLFMYLEDDEAIQAANQPVVAITMPREEPEPEEEELDEAELEEGEATEGEEADGDAPKAEDSGDSGDRSDDGKGDSDKPKD